MRGREKESIPLSSTPQQLSLATSFHRLSRPFCRRWRGNRRMAGKQRFWRWVLGRRVLGPRRLRRRGLGDRWRSRGRRSRHKLFRYVTHSRVPKKAVPPAAALGNLSGKDCCWSSEPAGKRNFLSSRRAAYCDTGGEAIGDAQLIRAKEILSRRKCSLQKRGLTGGARPVSNNSGPRRRSTGERGVGAGR
jgi:hypothetical protein